MADTNTEKMIEFSYKRARVLININQNFNLQCICCRVLWSTVNIVLSTISPVISLFLPLSLSSLFVSPHFLFVDPLAFATLYHPASPANAVHFHNQPQKYMCLVNASKLEWVPECFYLVYIFRVERKYRENKKNNSINAQRNMCTLSG